MIRKLFHFISAIALLGFAAPRMVCAAAVSKPASELRLPAGADLERFVSEARAGETVVAPAGHFRGDIVLPPGVSLRGAGYAKTIIDAAACDVGVTISGGHRAGIASLTVTGARMDGISVTHAANIQLAGLRVTGSMVGVNIGDCEQPQLKNVVSDHNRFGIVINRSTRAAVVNCTVADCAETGLLLPTNTGLTIFNTVMANVSTGLNIGSSTLVRSDRNLFMAQFVGVMADQLGRPNLFGWTGLSGLDGHSVQLPIAFQDPESGDYTPTSTLPWALDRPTTAGWGASEFGGIAAPKLDIRGVPKLASLGAFAAIARASRPPDGKFSVMHGDGVTSAGVFSPHGALVSYLFQNLPLAKGTYPFWLPSRDYDGRTIPAGRVDIRLVESRLRWQYLDHIGDNCDDRSEVGKNTTASHDPVSAAFVTGGGLLMGQDESEDHTNLRCYASSNRQIRWTMAGSYVMRGVAMGDDGYAYALRTLDAQSARLTRLDPLSGKLVAWGGPGDEHAKLAIGDGRGLAVMHGKLYTVAGGKLVVVDLAEVARNPQTTGVAETFASIPAPSCPTADTSTNCVWVISDGKLLALSPDGSVRANASPVGDPLSISASNGLLAIASGSTGKIHIFDAHDPSALKPMRTVGSGDGPFGPFSATRFLFKNALGWKHGYANVALGPDGQVAVIDWGRLILIDQGGSPAWYTYGIFGNQIHPSFSTGVRRYWDTMGERSFAIDERTGKWAPDAYWDVTSIPGLDREWQVVCRGDFSAHGHTFAVYCGHFTTTTIARLDGYRAVPVLMFVADPTHPGHLLARRDTNRDGIIDDKDAGEVVLGPDGNPLSYLFQRFEDLQPNGDLLIHVGGNSTIKWTMGGIDSDGVPIYRGEDRATIMHLDEKSFVDPYDRKPGGAQQVCVATEQPSGGYTAQLWLRGSGGTGANNGAGTDLLGLDADGKLRWVNQLSYLHGLAGMGTANGVTITSKFDSGEFPAFDEDGLGLGGFTEVPRLHYIGIWIDHPNLFMYKGLDGHAYISYGDNIAGRHPWYRLIGDDDILRQRISFIVSPGLAATLAAMPDIAASTDRTPPHPRIGLTHVNAPLAIDGSLDKWRLAGVPPQILMPPREGDARKAVAMIRLAYEGQNLYVQVLDFDNLPTFHFGPQCPVWQDCLEMAVNGAGIEDASGGFQFLAYRGPDDKTHVSRYRFFSKIGLRMLDPDHTPCAVTVLPDAHLVPERAELEALWGIDLSKSKVIVTEFKLPFDSQTYVGSEADCPQLGPGNKFWIGFIVDGSEFAGEELQHPMIWPPTFGFFSPKESGATVECR